MGFRLCEKGAGTEIELTTEMLVRAEEAAEVPTETYNFDLWYFVRELSETGKSWGKYWVSALKRD